MCMFIYMYVCVYIYIYIHLPTSPHQQYVTQVQFLRGDVQG